MLSRYPNMSVQQFSGQDASLFNSIVQELDLTGCEAQLSGMGFQHRRDSIGSCSGSSTGSPSHISNAEFEDFLMAVLQEELAAQVADAFLQEGQQ